MKDKFFASIKVGLLFVLFLFSVSSSQAELFASEASVGIHQDPHNTNDLNRGNIREFKDNYVPEQYFPMPEYLFYVDMGVMCLLILLGMYFVIKRKSKQSLSALLVIAFVYLGFIRGGCICPIGAISNTVMGIVDPSQIGLISFIVFLFPLLIALIAGRVFCSTACPLGAVQHIVQKKKKTLKLHPKLNLALKIVPIVILIATVYYAIVGGCFFVCKIEPYKVIFFNGQTWFEQLLAMISGQPMENKFLMAFGLGSFLYLMSVLVIGFWVPRPFCRFVCPYGVLLGIVSFFSLKPRKIKEDSCVYCGMCQKVCPTQAIVIDRKNKISKLSNYDCIQCNRCNDVCKKSAI